MKETLSKIHYEIRDQRAKVLKLSEDIEDVKHQIKLWELTQITNIANATDDDGKPLYSNETKRQAALEARKRDNEIYQEMNSELKQFKSDYDRAVITLQCLLDKQENMRALTRIMEVQ